MRGQFAVFILALTISIGCQNDHNTKATEEQTISTTLPDSIRQLYRDYLSTDTKDWPTEQIRENHKLYPVDEAPLDTSFYVFRQQLLQSIRNHNAFQLLDAIDKNITVSEAQQPGAAGFVTHFGLTPTAGDSLPIWSILENILEQGGVFEANKDVFTAPYLTATWPSAYAPATHGAISGKGVRIRSAPTLSSSIVKTVSYEIVKYIEETDKIESIGGGTFPWHEIELSNGQKGFVYGKFLARPNGYQAIFKRIAPNQWAITHLQKGG
ncbi:MAG: SH3 domain-containing protein [Mameliella sp.]|nr:SH3 domain-containing protein [Phaeodactylibacter sp.]